MRLIDGRRSSCHYDTNLISKPHLTVVVGAGASVELGMPSTDALTKRLWSALDSIHFRVATPQPPVRPLRELLDKHFEPANFEHVLHALETLHSWKTSSSPETTPDFRIVEELLASGLRNELTGLVADDYWLDAATRCLFRVLHEEIVLGTAKALSNDKWPRFAAFWQQLAATFDLHVVTLNYDPLVEHALGWTAHEQGFVPIDGESIARFDGFQAVPRLIHLHGNVAFGYRRLNMSRPDFKDRPHELYLHRSPSEAQDSWGIRSQPHNQSGRFTIVGPLITGMEKTSKLLVEPYATYQRHASNLLATHPRALVIGYSFGDDHITTLIEKMGRIHNAKRRVAIVDFVSPKPDRNDEWGDVWGGMRSMWGIDLHRRDFMNAVLRLSAEDDPLNEFSSREVWSSKDGCFCVHLCGLHRVAEHHVADLINFLAGSEHKLAGADLSCCMPAHPS